MSPLQSELSRRRFMEVSCAAVAGLCCGRAAGQQAPVTRTIRKAVKFQMVVEDLSVLDKFKLLQDIGFDGTEISTKDKIDRREVARAIEMTGLPVHGVVNSSNPDLRGAIELATYLGGNSVLIVAQEDDKQSYEGNFRHWQQLIRPAVPVAEKHQVRLLIENVRATFLKTAEEMARFIDSFDSPFVGAYFDTGNTITWTEQNAQHWARVLGRRIVKLDIKDRGHSEFGDAKLRSKTAVGTDGGEVHWEQVRAELDRVKYTGWATAEVKGGDRKRLAGIANWMNQVLNL